MAGSTILIHKHVGGLGHIVLNRPKALNAVNLEMIKVIHDALLDFAEDDAIRAVLITSSSERAFCAGGDVKSVALEARKMQNGDVVGADLCREIFAIEYKVNQMIHDFDKPVIALINGLCMGGGVGLSGHASHRVVCAETVFAMPEVFIGFFPDVGSSALLQNLPAGVARWLLLTGARLNGAQMLDLGLATHSMCQAAMNDLQKNLIATDWRRSDAYSLVNARLNLYQEALDQPIWSQEMRDEIATLFDHNRLESILSAVKASKLDIGIAAYEALLKACPMSLCLAFAHLDAVKGMAFNDVMAREFVLSQFCTQHPDFVEGVRAVLIDKDQEPRWTSQLPDSAETAYDIYDVALNVPLNPLR